MKKSSFLYDIKEEDDATLDDNDNKENVIQVHSDILDSYLIAVIGDEDTCVGYLLGGIGEINEEGSPNFFVVNPRTPQRDIEFAFLDFFMRRDIAIILITKNAADIIHSIVPHHQGRMPIVIEIPDKNGPYVINIDHILHIADAHEKAKDEQMNYLRERRVSVRRSSVDSVDGHIESRRSSTASRERSNESILKSSFY